MLLQKADLSSRPETHKQLCLAISWNVGGKQLCTDRSGYRKKRKDVYVVVGGMDVCVKRWDL